MSNYSKAESPIFRGFDAAISIHEVSVTCDTNSRNNEESELYSEGIRASGGDGEKLNNIATFARVRRVA